MELLVNMLSLRSPDKKRKNVGMVQKPKIDVCVKSLGYAMRKRIAFWGGGV
jgi:hypothetical protein